MQRLRKAWPITVLGILCLAPALRAQIPENVPAPAIDPDGGYTSPGPAKCVEIGNVYLRKVPWRERAAAFRKR